MEGCTAEGCTAECCMVEGRTVACCAAVAVMAIHITTIKLVARRADRLLACIVKEEGIITEGGSMVAGIKVEG